MTMTASLLANHISPSDCFNSLQAATSSTSRRSSTSLAFRQNSENPSHVFSNERFATRSQLPVESVRTSASLADESSLAGLPIWLSLDKSHLMESNMKALRDFMGDSFFTDKETRILADAIEEASLGNAQKIAGAAEFCLLLAETMDMGLDALTAAAFHYCSCVTAREHAVTRTATNGVVLSHHWNIGSYGTHVAEIESDAARLKQLELVAASVLAQSQGRSGRVSPDSRDAENLRHLLLTETKDWRALAIRSAACLYRLRGIIGAKQPAPTNEANRTAREALSIYAPLASRMGMHRLKNEIEGAAFHILYPRQYEYVTTLQKRDSQSSDAESNISESMQEVLEMVKVDITRLLEKDREFRSQVKDFSVTARVKEPYSMWKKMLRLGYSNVLQVPDALALRVVLDAKKMSPKEPDEVTEARERALCYYAQQLCQAVYKPVEGNPRLKDYISKPKRNGYQSLHYTANTNCGGEEWTLEVQVRSSAMHSVAEFGLASHWDYKAQQKKQPVKSAVRIEKDGENADKSSDAYLRNLQKWRWQHHGGKMEMHLENSEPFAWHSGAREKWIRKRSERLKPYLEALTDVQSDLARDHVFVFLTQQLENGDSSSCTATAEGKVLALPAGACVLDALRETERTMGMPLMRNQGFALNGIETTLTRQLQNGDILGIQCPSSFRTPIMA